MARHAGRVMSRDQIMDALTGHPLDAFDRSIDVHIFVHCCYGTSI